MIGLLKILEDFQGEVVGQRRGRECGLDRLDNGVGVVGRTLEGEQVVDVFRPNGLSTVSHVDGGTLLRGRPNGRDTALPQTRHLHILKGELFIQTPHALLALLLLRQLQVVR